jgi:CDGSH-type Zn-finger protein
MSDVPRIAKREPYAVEVEAGKTYWWCACGLSQDQPFCDGSHASTEITPVEYQATSTGTVYLCGCKRTSDVPLCDGTHNRLDEDGEAGAG